MFYIQLYSRKYILNSFYSYLKKETILPERGCIFDRKGKLLVYNKSIYELYFIPIKGINNFNISKFCKLINLDKNIFYKKIKNKYQYYPYTFISFLSKEKFATIQEELFKYKEIVYIKHFIRDYKVKNSLNLLGYVGKINYQYKNKEPDYYESKDIVGLTGIEKYYEDVLRGKKGVRYWTKNRKGSIINFYKTNINKAVRGNNLFLTIDWDLQIYMEKIMHKKKGGIVIINPNNGEILSLVSSPRVDPSFLENYNKEIFKKIKKNTIDNPFFDRAIQNLYPERNIYIPFFKKVVFYEKNFKKKYNIIYMEKISITPLKLANLMACVINKGFYYKPHLIKYINNIKNTYNYPYVKLEHPGKNYTFLKVFKNIKKHNYIIIGNKNFFLKNHLLFTTVIKPEIIISILIENGNFVSYETFLPKNINISVLKNIYKCINKIKCINHLSIKNFN